LYLKLNLEKLNEIYSSIGLSFVEESKVIKVKENRKYLLSDYPEVKEKLKHKFGMTFNDIYKWHISKYGEKNLKTKLIKIEPTIGLDELRLTLISSIKRIKEVELKESINQLLDNHPVFFSGPGAKLKHHDYKYGLFEHTIQVLKLSIMISKIIGVVVDYDLLIAGAILHDIGKINCYEQFENHIDITDTFLNQDHIINGTKIVSQEIQSEKLDDILHIIASHHYLKEWGSPVEPNSIEAWIIHFADNISAKIG
jgi:3'-5' exoribonuclease